MQKFFFIRISGKYVKINFQEIIYLEGKGNYIRIVTEHRFYMVLITMKQMEQMLPANLFRRIHKSYIVSLDKVMQFNSDTVSLKNKELPLGEHYRYELIKSVVIAGESMMEPLTISMSYSSAKAFVGQNFSHKQLVLVAGGVSTPPFKKSQ